MFNRVKMYANQVGLVFKNGKLVRILREGNHWIFFQEEVLKYNETLPFVAPIDLNILLQNTELAQMLDVVEVKDNEVVFQYVNGNFKDVLTAGKHAFWKGIMQYEFISADISNVEIEGKISKTLLDSPKVRPLVRKFTVATNESGLLYVDGKFVRQVGAGTWYFWSNNISVEIKSVDLRKQQLEISGQELLTKDKAALRINFYVWFKIADIMKVLTENKDYEKQLYVLMQLALREFIGALTLDELLSKKDSIGFEILSAVAVKAQAMGLELFDAGIRDVILPGDMKDIMNQVLIAEKKAQANIIMRREETASTRSLLNTAKLMEENAMLFKLKEMEYVEKIAEKINNISLSGSGQIVDQLKQIFVK